MATIHALRRNPAPLVPLHHVEAEQAVLGAVLVNQAVIRGCQFLDPADFYEPAHGRIWTAMRAGDDAGRVVDPLTLAPMADAEPALADMGGRRYLAELAVHAAMIVNVKDYARIVRDLARRRRLAETARKLADKADDRSTDADAAELYAEVQPELERAATDDTRPMGKDLGALAREIANGLLNPAPMFSTGIPLLDIAIGGTSDPDALKNGSVPFGYVVGIEARPKHFKTGMLHTIAVNVARQKNGGIPCCYLAAEMGALRLAKRMLGHIGKFKSQALKHPDDASAKLVARALRELPTSLVIEDCQGLTLPRLKQIASDHVTRRGVKVFFLDYFQLVAPSGKVNNKSEHLEEVAYWLPEFAYKHNVTWFVASQQNRDGHSLGSDGLIRACDWHCRINRNDELRWCEKIREEVATLWLDVSFARDADPGPIGSPDQPAFFIHPHGPHLAELA